MPQISYHLHLKGYVGGCDFDRSKVDSTLSKLGGKQVNVLIDSTGGALGTGLSISSAFKRHGNVNVHFTGLNASAATIASLGAKHISMDKGAMYLVHQCSMSFFDWGCHNADQFAELIKDCQKVKADLDKMDANVAALYASRCKRKPEDLLELMRKGAWLSSAEALEWGFVDEVTECNEDKAPEITEELALAMAAEGMPLPFAVTENLSVPKNFTVQSGPLSKFFDAVTSFLSHSKGQNKNQVSMDKIFKNICATLGVESLTLTDGSASLQVSQLTTLENRIESLMASIAEKDQEIETLKAKLKDKPAADTAQVTVTPAGSSSEEGNDPISDFCKTSASAKDLFNSIP